MSVYESESSTFRVYNHELQTQTQSQTQMHEALHEVPIRRTNSILSLTLDEIQMKSGKSFGTMNMDEFLSNLWTTVEENDNNGGGCETHHQDGEKPTVLPRQGSLSVPIPLSKKTVDEVWLEIQNGGLQQQPPSSSTSGRNSDEEVRRQQTLGEITLEDFLVKAGVVQEPLKTTMRMSRSDFGYNPEFGVGLHQNQHNYGDNRSVYNENRTFYSVLGESSNCVTGNGRSNQYLTGLNGFRIRKRIIDGPPEILIERRQRRMIKNRESAARSRARRQEENERKRRQEMMNRSQQVTKDKSGDKLKMIRRIGSASW